MEKEKIKNLVINIITGVIGVGVLIVGYTVFNKKDSSVASSIVETSKIAEVTASVGADVEATKKDLKALSSDVAGATILFELPEFKNLQNFTVEIPTEAIGRVNPFIPTAWKLKLAALESLGKKGPTPNPIPPPASSQTSSTSEPQTSSNLMGNFGAGI